MVRSQFCTRYCQRSNARFHPLLRSKQKTQSQLSFETKSKMTTYNIRILFVYYYIVQGNPDPPFGTRQNSAKVPALFAIKPKTRLTLDQIKKEEKKERKKKPVAFLVQRRDKTGRRFRFPFPLDLGRVKSILSVTSSLADRSMPEWHAVSQFRREGGGGGARAPVHSHCYLSKEETKRDPNSEKRFRQRE